LSSSSVYLLASYAGMSVILVGITTGFSADLIE